MDRPEFSRPYDVRHLPGAVQHLAANEAECAALAARFALVRVERLEAVVTLVAEGKTIAASGRLTGAIVQSCAVSGEDLPVAINEPLVLRFVPETAAHTPDEEIELDAADCDEIPYAGTQFDLGEALAQSLALAIDPYATGPGAERARQESGLLGEAAAGPFAALAKLKK